MAQQAFNKQVKVNTQSGSIVISSEKTSQHCNMFHNQITLKDIKSNAAVKLNEDDVSEAFCCHLSISADYIFIMFA